MVLRQAPDAGDARFSRAVRLLGDERDLAVVVVEADARQPLVGSALRQAQVLEVARVDGFLGQLVVEADEQRLVLGADRPDREARAVARRPLPHVLARVGPDGRPRQLGLVHLGPVERDARVEGEQSLGRGEQRVDVDLGDPALLDDEQAEADEQLLQRGGVDRPPAADAAKRAGDRRPLDHPPGQRRRQRRQPQLAVAEQLDERAAHAEEQHRPELRVDRRADDQLVAGVVDHRLDGDALEVLLAARLGHRRPHALERLAHRALVDQVEAHATDVGLVRDRAAVQLDDDRVADLAGGGDRFVGRPGHPRVGDRNAVGGQQLLRLDLGQ